MRILSRDAFAVLIDIQERLFSHMYNRQDLETRTLKLIRGLQALEIPIWVTEQYPKGLGSTIPAVRTLVESIEPIEKISFSCFGNELFHKRLERERRPIAILFGIESHVCVLQTALDLQESGRTPVVVEDCTSSRNPEDKSVAMRRLTLEGIRTTTYESLLFELCERAGTEVFKKISSIVK
jgi:hypothetical protein